VSELLTCGAVLEWLSEWPPDAVVGYPLCNDGCPLAIFLRARGCPTAHVYPTQWCEWESLLDDAWHPLPPWAAAFVQALDEEYGDGESFGALHPITAAQALAVLLSLELPEGVEA
jgi:hypothetical protein